MEEFVGYDDDESGVKKEHYVGKTKVLYSFIKKDVQLFVLHFRNYINGKNGDVLPGNGENREVLPGKGEIICKICSHIYTILNEAGIPTHFVSQLNSTDQLIKRVNMIPIKFVVRNIAAGSIVKRFGFAEGYVFKKPLLEFYHKNDKLGDPMLDETRIYELGLATEEEIKDIRVLVFKVNDILSGLFKKADIQLVDFKCEFGHSYMNGNIMLADEISPDTCRLWDIHDSRSFDKDVFRQITRNEVMERLLSSP